MANGNLQKKLETYEVINPANEEIIGHASKATPADVDKALKSAEKGLRGLEKNNLLGKDLRSLEKLQI